MNKRITVGEITKALAGLPRYTEITFGSSKYRKRPLVFYRFKSRGKTLLQIELNELDHSSENDSELESRRTVGEFLDELCRWKDSDEVIFGSTVDAVPLEFLSVKQVVAFNLDQVQIPKYRVERDSIEFGGETSVVAINKKV